MEAKAEKPRWHQVQTQEFQLIQKGRESISSPSCLEIKGLLQNLEGSPAKVQVASEKQSNLLKEAPGMKADGTGLYGNPGEPGAQARTGVLLETSQCSGAVSGNDSLVSQEPLSPASSEEEEECKGLPACARQAGEETLQNPGQEIIAVFNSPSVQQETFGTPSNHSLALDLYTCLPDPRLETTGQTFPGSSFGRTPWGDRMDLFEGACEVQEESLKSNQSCGRMEDLGEASELKMAKALLQTGRPEEDLSSKEHKGDDRVDFSSSHLHKGMLEIQKGFAVHNSWKEDGERFPSEHGRFLSSAEQLTVSKDRHSEISFSALCDVVQAASEDDIRVTSSEASRIQDDKGSFLRHEKLISLGKEKGALLLKRNNFGFFQNNCSVKYISALLSRLAHQLDFGGNGLPRVEPTDNLGTALLLCDLALPLCAARSFWVTETSVFADEKNLKGPQLCGPSPFAQKADPSLGQGRPVDSLSSEGVIVMRSPGAWLHHKKASGRLRTVMDEGAREMVSWALRGAENGEAAMEPFWRKAFRLSDRTMNDPSAAPEEIYALARNLFLDCRNLLKGRRRTATKIPSSLGTSPALLGSSGRFICLQKNLSPYRNNSANVDRAGSPLNSVYPLEIPGANLSKAEAENWSVNGGDAFDGSEGILEAKSNIFPPYEKANVSKASCGADAGGMKTIENAIICNNTRLFLQLAFDGDLRLCRATFRKGQCLEEEEKYQIYPSSSACNLSTLNKKDSSLFTKLSVWQREPIYQMKIFLYPYFLDSCTFLEQKNDSPKTEFLECQQHSLIFYKELNYRDLQTVISSAIKYVPCNKNESLHSKMELKVTPSATTLLTEYHQGPLQEVVIESSNNNNSESEFTGNLLNEDSLESQSAWTLFRCSESTSELLNRNDFVKNRGPQSKADGFSSASESVHKSPSEKFNFKNGLLSASKLASSPNQTPFQTDPTISTKIKGQERMKGLLLKSYRKRKISSLISTGLGSQFPQNKKMCLFQKDGALTFPSLKAHGSPLAKQPCRGTPVPEREAGGRSSPFGLQSERVSSSCRGEAAAAGPLASKRTPQRFKDSKAEAVLSLYSLEQSLQAKQDLEAGQREASWPAGMTEGFPVRILSDTEESSEALLENVRLAFRGGKVTFSFKRATHTGLPLCLPEDISESDSKKAKDSPEPSVTWCHVASPSCVLQTKPLSSSRKPAETLGSSALSSSRLKDGRLASFPRWPSTKEGHLLRLESSRELAGGPEKGLGRHLADKSIRRGISEPGAQPPPTPKEKPKVGRRRRLAVGQPPGHLSDPKAESPGDLARCTLASLGRAVQKRQQEPPFHMPSESKRQKRGQSCEETASLHLHFQKRSQKARSWLSSTGASGSLLQAVGCDQSRSSGAFGYLHLRRPFPAFRKLSRTACIKVGMPRRLRAPKPLASKGPPEMVPGENGELVYSAQLATKPAAPRAPEAIRWDPPARQQGRQSSSLASSWLTGQPKDAILLMRLSSLAEKLLAPTCRPFPKPCGALLPSSAVWGPLRRRQLLEISSFVRLKLNSPQWLNSSGGCFKMVGSQALPVYSIESTILCFFELSNGNPCVRSTPVFPESFHNQIDVGPIRKPPKTGSPSLLSRFALGSPQPQQPSRWSFSLLLPQSCPGVMPVQKDAEPGSASTPKEREAVARSRGCPTHGLPTALALFSPGCYRVWTRRRHLGSRIPAVQRLTLLQFARGFQGCPSVSADLFSSLPCLLGRALSIWSQHGPSTHLSESIPLHSGPSKGQPAHPAVAGLSHRTSLCMPPLVPGLPCDPPRAAKNHVRLEPILSVLLPTSCQAPEPSRPPLGFPALGSRNGHEASVLALPKTGAQPEKDESENRPKKVSQIRIRKTIPKPDPNLTPMGLPRPKRLKKTEFSLEEIYTNQNYKSPPATRCLETIFEEPKEKNGSLISISQQKRKRILEFQDFTVPRKRRARSRVRVTGGYTRAQKAAMEGRELDILLIQKLTDLETFFAKEETKEQASLCS
ncbi:protein PRR14L isoform X2 [Crotalus tigris]|uniref:protein PRR14L isoform X2 n=1 Tax=Crotalus tigris TaxID=88082 RepID=UPI00192F9F2B|nr:protein PRR14L isoform X2 [Crotalus tigris]